MSWQDILVEQQEVLTGLEKEKTGFIKVGTEETVRFGMKWLLIMLNIK